MADRIYLDSSFTTDVGFHKIREWLADHCRCMQNKNHFIDIEPISNKEKLKSEFEYTDELVSSIFRKDNLPHIRIGLISNTLKSLKIKEQCLEINQIIELKHLIDYFISLNKKIRGKHFKLWSSKIHCTENPNSVIIKIDAIIDDNNEIRDNASSNLKNIVKSISQIQRDIDKKVEFELKKYSKLGYLKENKIIYKEDRATLPVISSYKNKVKGVVDGFSSTRQTCFIQPLSLVELNNQLNNRISEKKKEIRKILKQLTSDIALKQEMLNDIYIKIKYYDIHYTKSLLAGKLNGTTPEFSDKIIFKDAINPLFSLSDKKYVPLNFSSDSRHKTIIISGPNSGGKTIVIKSIGLYALMAQSGIHIPSRVATLPIFKTFLSDIGDKQSLDDDLSTFSAHMKKISEIIKNSSHDSLIIIDEMGTGTDPEIGASLSTSVLSRLTYNKSFNLCTTHLTPIKLWANENKNSENASMEFDEKNIEPTFIFKMGIPGSSYGIEIANRMGIDKDIISNATKSLSRKSFQMENLIASFNSKQKDLEKKINEVDILRNELKQKEKNLNEIQKDLKNEKKEISKNRNSELEEELLGYRKKIEQLVENIKKNQAGKESIKEAQNFVSNTLTEINASREKYMDLAETNFSIGDLVLVESLNETGLLIDINQKNNYAVVEINNKKISISTEQLQPSTEKNTNNNYRTTGHNNVEPISSLRIDLRGMRVDEAIDSLEVFMDKSILSNTDSIEILHGKGTGALQDAVHNYLKESRYVIQYDFAPLDQGGSGITIVEF